MDSSQRIAQLFVKRIEENVSDEKNAMESIAAEFELSSRQIRRIVQKELGAPPIQLLQTRRLLFAKQLLTETKLPVTEIAFASGFESLRRFNDAFNVRYGMPPSRLRKRAVDGSGQSVNAESSTLQLAYRPPYDWVGILEFLKRRELKGVEWIADKFYARTVQFGKYAGWIRVTHEEKKHALAVEFSHSLTPILPTLLNRLRDLFDLNAQPELISNHLASDRLLSALVKANPGLRTPGAFNGFELGWRAVLGQQVTVKAASTIACRFVQAFGEPIQTPFPELNRLTPTASKITGANVDAIANLGVIGARARAILGLAAAQRSGELSLDSGNHFQPEATIERLAALPGIGLWTAHYIAMRALRWPDAFPKEDIVVRKRLGGVTAKRAEELSQTWRPWRSYAVLHLWRNSGATQ
jgi:AraC family transcriptional regulator of adaptative response / DNA-3-methyladenine glycosylase II